MEHFWNMFKLQMKSLQVTDIIDIFLVALLLYYVFIFIRDRRAGKLAVGVGLLVLIQILSSLLELRAMQFILQNIFQVGLIALVVVFQPELRSALETIGNEPIRSIKNIGSLSESRDNQAISSCINEICSAVSDLSADKVGALIVIERETKLGDVIKSGTVLNANISTYLLRNIFFNKAPLHDGAVIIRGWRIYAAGCFLPISQNESIIKDLGTRHRAGIGMSEVSDSIVIIVSEENGLISVASGGELRRGYTYSTLKAELNEIFSENQSSKGPFKGKRSKKRNQTESDEGEKEKTV